MLSDSFKVICRHTEVLPEGLKMFLDRVYEYVRNYPDSLKFKVIR